MPKFNRALWMWSVAAVAVGLVALAVFTLPGQRPNGQRVVVYTSVDQIFSEPVLRLFEEQTGIDVRVVYDTEETKSTGILNRLIAEGDDPQADVFWSGDPVRPFLLMEKDLVAPYVSPAARGIPNAFKADDGMWTGIAARARVLLVNRERLGDRPMPTSVQDLIAPQWKGDAAIANPLYGTTTMNVAAWFSKWGEAKAKVFLEALKKNDVRIASSNGEVKRLVVAGEVTFGLTDTDDAFVAIQSGAPVEVVYPDEATTGTLVMPTSVVLIRDGPHTDTARQLIDFLLSPTAEAMLAESAAHMPLHADAEKPAYIHGVHEVRALDVDYRDIAAQMENIQPWLRTWAGL